MSHPKLLKAPARMLLLALMSARIAVATPTSTPSQTAAPVGGHRMAASARQRVRPPSEEMDSYTFRHGVPRWGLNE